jgi:hypothetical protein
MTEQPLSVRAYACAMRMHQSDNRLVKPKLEDFTDLDLQASSPAPVVPAVPPPARSATECAALDDRVRATLERMQSAARVAFAPPPEPAA